MRIDLEVFSSFELTSTTTRDDECVCVCVSTYFLPVASNQLVRETQCEKETKRPSETV